jgi:hypothetical protein
MEFLSDLWLPILVSSALVFIASFLTHMVLPIHKGEWQGLRDESNVVETLAGVAPGNYMFPWGTMADMKNPEFVARRNAGPNGTIVIWKGPVDMGKNLILTFLTYVLIGVFIGYLLWHAIGTGDPYMKVFRLAGTAAFMAHGLALIPHAVWYGGMRLWSHMLNTLIYALVTAGAFAWLWPR